jgi:hypothetical protein
MLLLAAVATETDRDAGAPPDGARQRLERLTDE